MQHSLAKSSIRVRLAKAFVPSLVAVIVFTNLALTGGRAKSEEAQIPVDSRLTAAASKFSFKLYNDILKRRTTANTFISPASVMLALVMTYNGSAGTTRQAMSQTLELEGMSLEEVNSAFAALKSALAPNDPKVQLKIANSLWARRELTLNPAFVARNEKNFGAEIANLDFSDPAATNTINSWVTKNTEGKIQKIVEQIKDDDVLFLINAIYFKGQWQFEFKKENTKPDTFRVPAGGEKQVSMMSQSGQFYYYRGKDFQSVALPYGTGRVSMYIFLPDEQARLDQFEQSLTPENWDTWMKSFSFAPGDLMLPRFKVEWEAELNKTLIALGMAEAFDPDHANFSLIPRNSRAGMFISEVKHKSLCEVNEEGTVAAAVTAVGMSTTSYHKPPEKFVMKVDHPFFFVIRDNATGLLLFMGSVTNPG